MKAYVIIAAILVAIISIGGIVVNLGGGSTTKATPSHAAPTSSRPSSSDNFKF